MTFEEWLDAGVASGYCAEPSCAMHGLPFTPEEEDRFEAGEDPCVSVVRIFPEVRR